jgi:ribosomal protein S27E
MDWEEIQKQLIARRQLRVRCKKCGWGRIFVGGYTRLICKNCGSYVFKNDKEEFKYRVKERLNKYGREERSKNNTKEE